MEKESTLRNIIFLIIGLLLIGYIRRSIIIGEFEIKTTIVWLISSVILGFLAYIMYRSSEGKKISTVSKVFAWIIAIFLILTGIFSLLFAFFAFTHEMAPAGILTLVFGLVFLLGGAAAVKSLTKRRKYL